MSQRITMEEVARQSGVSLATVSLVLRDKPGINGQTRQRVMDTARTLGYQKRPPVETVTPGILSMVGMVTKIGADEPVPNPFYAPVVAGIEAACRRQQINLLYGSVLVDHSSNPLEMPRLLLKEDLNGLLLLGAFVDSTISRMMERRATPTVLVDAYAAENVYDSVLSDNFGGAYEAVTYLIEHGHMHIAMVGGSPDAYPSLAERRRGYLQALQDRDISETYYADGWPGFGPIADSALGLLERSPQITAMFCCNDATAIAVMQALQATGRRVPEDLSIIGFDDIDLAQHVTPALTTMHVDKSSMGRLAVQLLANRAESPDAARVTAVLRPILIERQSVRSLIGG